MITIREMAHSELYWIGEIDRSEEICQVYLYRDGHLQLKDEHWSVPRWAQQGPGDHTVEAKIAAWRPWVEDRGQMFGAFDGEALAAVAIYRPHLGPGTAQFAVLHVSRAFRRRGLGAALAARVIESATNDGATKLYVSATSTRGTVDFYRSLGFEPTNEVNPELFELEPEDIHMIMDLGSR